MPATIAKKATAPKANIVFANFASSATMDSMNFSIFLHHKIDSGCLTRLIKFEVDDWVEDAQAGCQCNRDADNVPVCRAVLR